MPMFNTGDRVRCIEEFSIRGEPEPRFGVLGHIYEVYADSRNNGEVYVIVDGNNLHLSANRFQRVNQLRARPPVQENASTFYTLIYKTRNASKRCMGFETQEEFNTKKRDVLANGGTVFGEKKLKLSNVG